MLILIITAVFLSLGLVALQFLDGLWHELYTTQVSARNRLFANGHYTGKNGRKCIEFYYTTGRRFKL
jgi:hypothetical protein